MGRNLHYYRAFGTDQLGNRVFFVFLNYDLPSAAKHASTVFDRYTYWYDCVERIPAAKGKVLFSAQPLFKPIDTRHQLGVWNWT